MRKLLQQSLWFVCVLLLGDLTHLRFIMAVLVGIMFACFDYYCHCMGMDCCNRLGVDLSW